MFFLSLLLLLLRWCHDETSQVLSRFSLAKALVKILLGLEGGSPEKTLRCLINPPLLEPIWKGDMVNKYLLYISYKGSIDFVNFELQLSILAQQKTNYTSSGKWIHWRCISLLNMGIHIPPSYVGGIWRVGPHGCFWSPKISKFHTISSFQKEFERNCLFFYPHGKGATLKPLVWVKLIFAPCWDVGTKIYCRWKTHVILMI